MRCLPKGRRAAAPQEDGDAGSEAGAGAAATADAATDCDEAGAKIPKTGDTAAIAPPGAPPPTVEPGSQGKCPMPAGAPEALSPPAPRTTDSAAAGAETQSSAAAGAKSKRGAETEPMTPMKNFALSSGIVSPLKLPGEEAIPQMTWRKVLMGGTDPLTKYMTDVLSQRAEAAAHVSGASASREPDP